MKSYKFLALQDTLEVMLVTESLSVLPSVPLKT